MNRRKSIKTMALGVVSPMVYRPLGSLFEQARGTDTDVVYKADWHEWPDIDWTGPGFWGNRLQDWRIRNGRVECLVRGMNRTLYSLTTELSARRESFGTSVSVQLPGHRAGANYTGFRLGAKSTDGIGDYRRAAIFGEGLDVGITLEGCLFIGQSKSQRKVDVTEERILALRGVPDGMGYRLQLSVSDNLGNVLDELTAENVDMEQVTGLVALVLHHTDGDEEHLGFPDKAAWEGVGEADLIGGRTTDVPMASFADWQITGPKVIHDPNRVFGPICFAQYTLHQQVLKLTAQLAPVERIHGHRVILEVNEGSSWQTIGETTVEPAARIASFRTEGWNRPRNTSYRIRLVLPLQNGTNEYIYEGTLATEPVTATTLKVAVFSCNADHGFPDTEVARNVQKHQPDMAVFLGDQIYEANGGFRIQTSPPHKAVLDYLRKWYMFGWSYRDIFRHIPCAIIPDDHDVYHGNVWGEGGKQAPTDEGFAAVAQDQGGFKMPPVWVNMIQRTQTGHLPDPYDPTPAGEGIRVYYTAWNYAGVSFAILEDRKFKSAPQNVLPAEVKVVNGFVQNPDEQDIKKYRDIKADLLGERQLRFLEEWGNDWRTGTQMKVVLSQTSFCTIETLPAGSVADSIAGSLPVPVLGEYITGDAPAANMDSNGWPQQGRDDAVRLMRRCFAFHIAGDQHLAAFARYGVDAFGDSGFVFAGPALNNLHPRRWWPNISDHQPLPGKPAYTGDFLDGFGNRMTIHAVANPRKTGMEPARVYDRATGYGIVTFDKSQRTVKTECWSRYIDPVEEPDNQYEGWPITVTQEEQYGRRAQAWLPVVKVNGLRNPVIEIIHEQTGERVYTLRISGNRFQPKVFSRGTYTVRVSEPDTGKMKERKGVPAAKRTNKTILFTL